jgi:hypothetical protein
VWLESLRAAFESEFPLGFYLIEETQFQEWLEGISLTHCRLLYKVFCAVLLKIFTTFLINEPSSIAE